MLARLSESNRDAALIAVEIVGPDGESFDSINSSLIYLEQDPKIVPEGNTVLGFDVADEAMLSGLSNCGYTPQELEGLRPVWQSRMNDHGLLISVEDALEFMKLSDERVEEHAPFWVYKLYKLRIG
jgi:hypothetical protein